MGDMADLLNDTYFDEHNFIDACGNYCNPFTNYSKAYYKQHLNWDKLKGPGECPKCSGPTVLRNGKYGKFYGCYNFPDCTGSRYHK